MRRNYYLLPLISGAVLLFSSCAKEGPTGPIGPAGPGYTGAISGHISLYDQYGSKVLTNLSSIKILLSSTTAIVSADTPVSPDYTGYYYYGNLVSGEYNIAASDTNGYGATITNNFQYLSGALNRDIKLSAIPTFSLTFSATHNPGSLNDSLIINCSPNPQPRSCIIFVNNIAIVGAAETNYLLSYVKAIPANATKVTAVISGQELYNTGLLVSGNMAYYAVYSYAVNDQSVYEDQVTGKNVYNAVSNPQIDSAIVP